MKNLTKISTLALVSILFSVQTSIHILAKNLFTHVKSEEDSEKEYYVDQEILNSMSYGKAIGDEWIY
jgi:hypothetical protein